MVAKVEEIGPCKKKICVEIGTDKIQEKLDEKYQEFLKTANIHGFRKGHVPRKLAEKRYGDEVRSETQEALMSEALQETVEENDLKVIGSPHFDNISFEENQPMTYEVTLNVKPTFTLKEYKGITATCPATVVSDDELNERIDQLRRSQSQMVPVEDEKVTADHHLMTSFRILVEEEEIMASETGWVSVGETRLFGMPCENLAELFVGKEVGDTVEVTLTLPNEYPKEEYRGKEATIQCTITEIKKMELPELNDEWAALIGFETIDELLDSVRKRMESEKKAKADADVEDQVLSTIIADNDFAIPEDMVDHDLEHRMTHRREHLEADGKSAEAIDTEIEKTRAEERETQIKQFKEYFVLDKIAEDERIFATENDVEERIAIMASSQGYRPADLRHKLEEDDSLGKIRDQIREDKTRALLRENAVITEAEADKPKPKKKATTKKSTAKKSTAKKSSAAKKKKKTDKTES